MRQRRFRIRPGWPALLILLALSTPVAGQSGGPFTLSSSTLEPSGMYLFGWDSYYLHGVVGQVDAGALQGGQFHLDGGFHVPEQTRVYAAHMASTDLWSSRFSVTNIGRQDHKVFFQVYNADGLWLGGVDLASLPPNATMAEDAAVLFPPPLRQGDVWVVVFSESPLKAVIEFGAAGSQAVLPLLAASSRDLVFPYVVLAYGWYTGLTLINTTPGPASATLQAYSEQGTLLATETVPIVGMGKYVRLINQCFPTVADCTTIRLIKVRADQPLIGFELFGNFGSPGLTGLPAFPVRGVTARAKGEDSAPERIGSALYYNEIPANADWYTGVTFSNLGSTDASVLASLYDDLGNILATAEHVVRPMEQFTREIWNLFDGVARASARTMQVSAREDLLGFELFLNRTGGPEAFRFDGLPAVSSNANVYRTLNFPLVRCDPAWSTTLSLTNKSDLPATAELRVFTAAGVPVASPPPTLSLAPHQSLTVRVLDFIPTATDAAFIQVVSDQSLLGDAWVEAADHSRLVSYLGF